MDKAAYNQKLIKDRFLKSETIYSRQEFIEEYDVIAPVDCAQAITYDDAYTVFSLDNGLFLVQEGRNHYFSSLEKAQTYLFNQFYKYETL